MPTPEVTHYRLQPDDAFLILASDGVWEFIESDEAVEIVGGIFNKGWSAEAACKHLIARAAVEWMNEEGDYRDDITCVIAYLSCRDEMRSESWEDYGAVGGAAAAADGGRLLTERAASVPPAFMRHVSDEARREPPAG